jgi:hypothetical protein
MGLHYLELNSTKVPKYDKVGLVAAKAAALRINLNVQGCVIVATPMHAPSRTPLLRGAHTSAPPPSFTHSPYPPRSLVRDGDTNYYGLFPRDDLMPPEDDQCRFTSHAHVSRRALCYNTLTHDYITLIHIRYILT